MAGDCCGIFQRWLSIFLYAIGIGLSSFAYYIELKKEADENYVALCDMDEFISCSSVFNSTYGKGFGLVALVTGDEKHPLNQPNALYGIIFYSLLGLFYLCSGNSRFMANLQFYSFVLANIMSCYLAYILYFILKTLCVVCVSTYAVNLLLLMLSYCKRRSLRKRTPSVMETFQRGPTLPGSFDFKKNI